MTLYKGKELTTQAVHMNGIIEARDKLTVLQRLTRCMLHLHTYYFLHILVGTCNIKSTIPLKASYS